MPDRIEGIVEIYPVGEDSSVLIVLPTGLGSLVKILFQMQWFLTWEDYNG